MACVNTRVQRGNLNPDPSQQVTTKALLVWGASLGIYIVALTGRTSFGVAGVAALERFDVSTAALAVFTSVQVGTYALLQIPMGVAVDKFGPRRMLVGGAIVMGIGQIVLGFTHVYAVAIFARVLIGAGDATAFLSVMRILPYWFPLHRAPMFTQITAMAGQLGQFISAVPFLWLLGVTDWTVSFVSLGAVGILVALAAYVAIADAPTRTSTAPSSTAPNSTAPDSTDAAALVAGLKQRLCTVVVSATTWNAFFIHFTSLLPVLVFTMMWGVPLMLHGMSLSNPQAGTILTLSTIVLLITGPLHGKLSARLSGYRDWVTLILCLIQLACWGVFFASPTPRGFGAMAVMMIVMAGIQPVSNFGFDTIRERLPRTVVATATGLSNMGGFLAGMLGAQLAGIVLADKVTWPDFQRAGLALAGLWVLGFIGLIITHVLKNREHSASAAVVQQTEQLG